MSLLSEPNATREELEAYIGPRATGAYYKKVLDTYMKNPNKPVWCWPAFILNIFWLCHRKALVATLLLLCVYFTLFTMVPMPFSIFALILTMLIIGIYGVNLYLLSAESEIEKIKKVHINSSEKKTLDAIAKRGGISFYYALVLYIVLAILSSLLLFTIK